MIARGVLIAIAFAAAGCGPGPAVGSKKFTESVILGEIAHLLARDAGLEIGHRRELGGTRVLWNALLNGEIEAYPEYTGTLREEILGGRVGDGDEALRAALAEHRVEIAPALGFENNYAIAMMRETAARLGCTRISDLVRHPALRLRFSNEFLDRGDGWRALRRHYALPQTDVRGVDHDLGYRGLADGSLDVTVVYTTDAEIRQYDLALLEDDRGHFPRYRAAFVYRADLATRRPDLVRALESLGGKIDTPTMVAMNARAKLDRVPEAVVAADFLEKTFAMRVVPEVRGVARRIFDKTLEHLFLVVISLFGAVVVGVPLGVTASRRPGLAPVLLGVVGVIQTIPSLALLVLLMPLLGGLGLPSLGALPAIIALFLYSLLPIVRNTLTGLTDIDPSLRESAIALGLPAGARLRRIELPLASRTIVAGIKTAAVINVGFATLGALIGAGGYGDPILAGIRLDSVPLVLEGAVPAALLALAVQAMFAGVERAVVPKGLSI